MWKVCLACLPSHLQLPPLHGYSDRITSQAAVEIKLKLLKQCLKGLNLKKFLFQCQEYLWPSRMTREREGVGEGQPTLRPTCARAHSKVPIASKANQSYYVSGPFGCDRQECACARLQKWFALPRRQAARAGKSFLPQPSASKWLAANLANRFGRHQ
jgi:hypothetical protein